MKAAITPSLYPRLQGLLSLQSSADPCLNSAAYLAMTGRKGLWLHQIQGAAALSCQHPNRPAEQLWFPPFGPSAGRLLRHISPTSRVGRVPASQPMPGFIKSEERLLDWRYPVHTLDTTLVANLDGPDFRKLRQTIRQVQRAGIQISPLRTEDAAKTLDRVCGWAITQNQDLSLADFMGPYEAAFSLLSHTGLDVRGLAFTIGGELVSFYIWDHLGPERPAVGLSSYASREIRGLADYQHVKICEHLSQLGVSRLCIGGAETAGLDAFKRKFRPVQSIALVSADRTAPQSMSEAA